MSTQKFTRGLSCLVQEARLNSTTSRLSNIGQWELVDVRECRRKITRKIKGERCWPGKRKAGNWEGRGEERREVLIGIGKNPSPTSARDSAKIKYINEDNPNPMT